MKSIMMIILTVTLMSSSAMACDMPNETYVSIVTRLMTEKGINEESIKVSNVDYQGALLFSIPMIVADLVTQGESCAFKSSLRGVHIWANVEYVLDNEICTAKFYKPDWAEKKIYLKDVDCK